MMTAHVNREGIVLRFSVEDNLPTQQWEILLDQLNSVYLPSFYPTGKRLVVMPEGAITKAVIYLTSDTVTLDQAIDILHHWNIEVHDVRIEPTQSVGN
jgi:hypothetical protein